jgi:hypothetical protein
LPAGGATKRAGGTRPPRLYVKRGPALKASLKALTVYTFSVLHRAKSKIRGQFGLPRERFR